MTSPRPHIPEHVRRQVVARAGGECEYQGPYCEGAGREIDHIDPWSTSRNHHPDNLRWTCRKCNRTRPSPQRRRGPQPVGRKGHKKQKAAARARSGNAEMGGIGPTDRR